jgi:hypothetical protein
MSPRRKRASIGPGANQATRSGRAAGVTQNKYRDIEDAAIRLRDLMDKRHD